MIKLKDYLSGNEYPGRGIVIGATPGGNVAIAYFIMGRSVNSRNRVFVADGDGIRTEAKDPSKLVDPSLIIYAPVRVVENKTVVTNGDQTDTVRDFLNDGKTFEEALETRCYEPDEPNFTPRISGMVTEEECGFTYKLSILKHNEGECERIFWDYKPMPGVGHIIHTYDHDGNPIPSFSGDPVEVEIPDSIENFTSELWENLNEDNKVSLFVRYIDTKSKIFATKLINKL